jgi:hypothetical protein
MVRIEITEEDKSPKMIRKALAGRNPRISESLALALVSELAIPESEQRDILREALENPGLQPPVRALAARSLAKLGTDIAIQELLRVLEAPELEEPVAVTAAVKLGLIGGPDHLAPLQHAKESATSEFLRQRAAFAEAMIVHRFGISDYEIQLPAAESQPAPQAVGALPFISREPGHRAQTARAWVTQYITSQTIHSGRGCAQLSTADRINTLRARRNPRSNTRHFGG